MTTEFDGEEQAMLDALFFDKFGYHKSDMERIEVNAAEPHTGAQIGVVGLRVHPASACANDETCCIHKPSDHHMREWQLNWRADRGMMERIDPKTGIGHPDPDDVSFHMRKHPTDKYYAVHGCDGGCRPPEASF